VIALPCVVDGSLDFFVFFQGVLHMRVSAGVVELSLQVYRQFGAGLLVLSYKQTDPDLYFRTRILQ